MPRNSLPCLAGALAAAALLAACGSPGSPPPPTADPATRRALAHGGEVVGFRTEPGVHVWRGIPFAAPPIGSLRWRSPHPPEPWQGARETLAFGASCPQIATRLGGRDGAAGGEPTGDEDCLTLNVFAPPFEADAVPRGAQRRPVLFWIHGGGNSIGDAVLYDPSNLVLAHDVVVVTTHYRLGPFGWLRHGSLRGEGTRAEDRSGNFGTLDLIRSLEWVRDNIAAFGGDPRRVTIFGESAGGSNVYTLLLSPLARGLFQRAVVQSGGLRTASVAEAESYVDAADPGHEASSNEMILRLLQSEGAVDRGAAREALAGMSAREVETFLREREPADILRAYDSWAGSGMLHMPKVFRDGFVLPEDPFRRVLAEGRYNQVPVILGSNRDESKLFMAMDPTWVRTVFGVPLWAKDVELYDRASHYSSSTWKAVGVDGPAEAMRRAQGPTVWAYRFDWDELPSFLWWDGPQLIGAAHALEIPFVFGRFELGRLGNRLFSEESRAGREALSRAMMSYWAQLAWEDDPGRGRDGSQPLWSAWGVGGKSFAILDSEADGGIRMADARVSVRGLLEEIVADPTIRDDATRCDFLRGLADRALELPREEVDAMPACAGAG